MRLAATNPELVRGIVLTGVPLLRPETAAAKPAFGFRALRFLNKWHFISNDLMEKERRKRGSADYRAAEGEMREVLVKAVNEDYGDALDALASNGLPVAMVWGEHDTAATTAMAERARARIGAHADLVVVPGSAHLLDDGLVAALRTGDRRPGRATMSATANVLVGLAISLLALASYLRWWRVAQREHYEPGRLVAMAAIWCRAQPTNILALAAVLVLCLVGLKLPLVGLVGAVVWLLWPPGLALLRPAKKLVWTPRVRRLAVITVVLHVVVTGFFLAFGEAVALVPLLALPIAEVALLAAHPLEDQLGRRYEVSAAARIKQVAPRVVAITGSYGKTSTKNYAAHLMAGRWSVLASPASFNNVLGLARAVNDRLTPGTDVFVAEMGTYGPGEIARLCRLFPPEVSAITTIGEAHLERMKDRATIVRAKSEILEPAKTIVLNVDVPELAEAAEQYAATKRVIRCATTEGATADVVVRRDGDGWLLVLSGQEHRVALPAEVGHPINVAVAVGLALAVDVPEQAILDRLASVPATPHRAETTTLDTGVTVIDDTYNANPEGAAQALVSARSLVGEGGTVWTITPGMVELGPEQVRRNADFARAATADEGMQLAIVGHTNRTALRAGDASRTQVFGSREEAARHVMATAAAGDVVLYENDLPDHYP